MKIRSLYNTCVDSWSDFTEKILCTVIKCTIIIEEVNCGTTRNGVYLNIPRTHIECCGFVMQIDYCVNLLL